MLPSQGGHASALDSEFSRQIPSYPPRWIKFPLTTTMSSFLERRKKRLPRLNSPAPSAPVDSPNKPEGTKSDGFAGLPQATTAWIGAIGITAGLAAAGFIGKLALQQFLGVELGNWTALDLSIFAGRWAIDTLTIVLQGTLRHPLWWGGPILLYLAPTILSFSFPLDDKRGQIAARASIVLAFLGLCYALVWCEMPTLSLNGWLTSEISHQLDKPDDGLLSGRETDLRATLLVSKMDGVANSIPSHTPGGAPSLNVCGLTGDKIPDTLRHHLKTDYPVSAAVNRLRGIYAACVIICLTSLLALYLHQVVEKPTLVDDGFRALRLFASFVLLPLVVCLVPYMYGKLIYPSTFPSVTVTYKNGDAPQAAAQADDKTKSKPNSKPAADAPAAPAPKSTKRMLIVDETDKDISLLDTDTNLPYEIQIRDRSEITNIVRYDKEDVLNIILMRGSWLPSMPVNCRVSQGVAQ